MTDIQSPDLDLLVSPPSAFAALGLKEELAAAVQKLGYEEPTPIQRAAIPPLIAGRDVLGQAATGTGKTAAFALPLLHRICGQGAERRRPRALVLVPTRELAQQVAEAIEKYGQKLGIGVAAIYGGSSFPEQVRALDRRAQVIVATPGRTVDHLTRGTLSLEDIQFVVLDEADEMLDMGFADDLEQILSKAPKTRQTALFSATLAPRIAALAEQHLQNPARICIAPERRAEGEAPRVRQVFFPVTRSLKLAALGRILEAERPAAAIVFCRTRLSVDEITEAMCTRGQKAEALHGGLSQDQRERVLERFRDGRLALLVATDVAARGLDIDHLSHVINFDLPMDADVYVHRIGRTGRAGREGVALSLFEPRERRILGLLESRTGTPLELARIPALTAIEESRRAQMRTALEDALAAELPAGFTEVIEELSERFEPARLAAAALALAHRMRFGSAPACSIPDDAFQAPRPAPRGRDLGRRDPRAPGAGRRDGPDFESRRPRNRAESAPRAPVDPRAARSSTRLYIGAGRDLSIKPLDLIRAVTATTGLPKNVIGPIHISEQFSLMEVATGHADAILQALCRTRVAGRVLRARYDRESS